MSGNAEPNANCMINHVDSPPGDSVTRARLQQMLATPEFADELRKIPRHKLLPTLFKIRGIPYSIDDYPQFEPMYAREYTPDMLFMTGRQVAKSSNLSRSEVLDLIQIPNYQVLYVAPLQAQSIRFSNLYLREAINTCGIARKLQSSDCRLGDGPVIKAVHHQAFLNNSGVQLMYAKTSADRARGITADRIDFDEIQDQLIDHVPIIKESTTNSAWGTHRYTGTAKTCDNTIEDLWQSSSQAEWAVKCGHCGFWNIPNKEMALKMISAAGPICAKCGKDIVVRDGHYVHAYPELVEEFPGFHVPQIVVPAIAEDPSKWLKLVSKVHRYPESLVYTEILGISSDVGARLISQIDIDNASILGTHESLRQDLSRYAHIVLGVDWGIAEVTSFTVSAVVGITHTGEIHVLFGKRYIGENPEAILEDLARTFNSYRCRLIAPDFGMGFTNNSILRNRGMPVSMIQYTVQNSLMNYNELNGIPRWMVDRNTALQLVFWGVKYGKIFFANKEDSATYTVDLLSPYEHVTEASAGISYKKFLRNPKRPDDFCHALTFAAIMAMKLTGDSMLSLVPEHSMDYTGQDWPEPGTADVSDHLG